MEEEEEKTFMMEELGGGGVMVIGEEEVNYDENEGINYTLYIVLMGVGDENGIFGYMYIDLE